MTLEKTVATDSDMHDLAGEVGVEIQEAIRAAVDDPDVEDVTPCRVTVDVDAEPIAEPAEGAGARDSLCGACHRRLDGVPPGTDHFCPHEMKQRRTIEVPDDAGGESARSEGAT